MFSANASGTGQWDIRKSFCVELYSRARMLRTICIKFCCCVPLSNMINVFCLCQFRCNVKSDGNRANLIVCRVQSNWNAAIILSNEHIRVGSSPIVRGVFQVALKRAWAVRSEPVVEARSSILVKAQFEHLLHDVDVSAVWTSWRSSQLNGISTTALLLQQSTP